MTLHTSEEGGRFWPLRQIDLAHQLQLIDRDELRLDLALHKRGNRGKHGSLSDGPHRHIQTKPSWADAAEEGRSYHVLSQSHIRPGASHRVSNQSVGDMRRRRANKTKGRERQFTTHRNVRGKLAHWTRLALSVISHVSLRFLRFSPAQLRVRSARRHRWQAACELSRGPCGKSS